MTGVPLTRLEKEEAQRLLELENELHKRVVSQDAAIKAVSKEELAGFIRAYCDLTERESGLFVVSEAFTEMGIEHAEKLIDLR